MAGLTSSFNFNEEERNTKMNNMWRTGQVPMEVKAMPGLVFDKSDYEDVKAMLPENSCFFCRKLGHMKRDSKEFIACGTRKTEKFANWNKKNPIRK